MLHIILLLYIQHKIFHICDLHNVNIYIYTSTATFVPTPTSLQRTVHHSSCQAGGTWAKYGVERLVLDPPCLQPGPERMRSQAVDFPQPQCSAGAAAAPLSPASAGVTSMCFPPSSRGPMSQVPGPLHYLLTLEGRFLNCRSNMEILFCPLQLLGWASGRLGTSLYQCCLLYPHHLHMGKAGLPTPSQRPLARTPLPEEGLEGRGPPFPQGS